MQQVAPLFDHLVGAEQCRSRYFEAERSGGLKIEDELEFRCLLDRKIGGIGTLENLIHEDGRVAKGCNKVHSIAQRAASAGDLFRSQPREAARLPPTQQLLLR